MLGKVLVNFITLKANYLVLFFNSSLVINHKSKILNQKYPQWRWWELNPRSNLRFQIFELRIFERFQIFELRI